MRQRRTKGQIYNSARIDRPAVTVEQRCQITLAQLEIGNNHRRTRDQQDQTDDSKRHLPRFQAHKTSDHRSDGRTDSTDRQADGSENTGKFADIERHRWRFTRLRFLRRVGHARGCFIHRRLITSSSHLLDLLADHLADAFIGIPKRLPNADRMLDNLDNTCIPVITAPVEKHPITANHQIISVTVGHSGGDGHFFLTTAPPTLAIRQIDAA